MSILYSDLFVDKRRGAATKVVRGILFAFSTLTVIPGLGLLGKVVIVPEVTRVRT